MRKLMLAVAAWFALSLVAGPALIGAAPPPPRFGPIPNDFRVIAVWAGSQRHASVQTLEPDAPVASDTALISKSASPASVAPNSTLHYTVAITNATNLTQTFRLTDTLPAGLSYLTATASGGVVYNAASLNLTATRSLAAFHADVITTTGAPPYTEISGTLSANICQTYFTQCDNNAITLAGVPFLYLGANYTTITLDSNGFVMPGSGALGSDGANQDLPDSAAPNNVIAPFWDDLDLDGQAVGDSGGGDWWYGVQHNAGTGADYLVVEWHHAQKKNDALTDYSFQVWIQLHAEHITFAYKDLALTGDTSSASIGFENSNGTLGHAYLYNGVGQVPGPEAAELRLIADFDTAQLGFDVKGQHSLPGCSTISNTVLLSNAAGTLNASASAVTATFGPCRFLPLINR